MISNGQESDGDPVNSLKQLSELANEANVAFLRAARAGILERVLDSLKHGVDINYQNANGLNALHLASKEGHLLVVEELLARGADVDGATKKGNTALHISALAGKTAVVRALVEHGARVNVQSQAGFTALYMAAQENHDDVVRYLLEKGGDPSLTTEEGYTPLAVALQQGSEKAVGVLLEYGQGSKVKLPALHIAAKKDDVGAAALLLKSDNANKENAGDLVNETTKSGFTPLHIAAHYGKVNVAKLLIDKGADVNYKAKNAIAPLHVAAKWGQANMVALLLERSASINIQNKDGLTPLHCAARSGYPRVLDYMLEKGADHAAKTKNGLTPLHMATQGDHVDCARLLLHYQASVDDVTVDYLTALHVAAHYGHVKTAKLLLDRNCEPNARALNGFTSLHIACKKNRIKVVELLLKYGASIEATTESGLTPLHVAAFMGNMNIVLSLLQNGAAVDQQTLRGETPLHLAARANQTDVMRILLRNKANVNAKAREQQTPLHISARMGNVDSVLLLLQHGAAPEALTKDGYTPLHIAAKEGHEEVAAVLVDQGAAPDCATKKGMTPVHIAAKYGQKSVARLLLQRGAAPDSAGKNGLTPLHVAAHYSRADIGVLLLESRASPHCAAKNGYTPLHIAAKKNQMDMATSLLEYGARPDTESKTGFAPLHLASQEGHTDMISLLLEHKSNANCRAANGLTPMHLCAQEDNVCVAEILCKYNAEIDPRTKAGYTPLHTASHFGQVNMVRFLLQRQAAVNATTRLGYAPLHQAAQQGHAHVIGLLLKCGASPDARTNTGLTALHIARRLGYVSVEELLKGVTTDAAAPPPNAEAFSTEKYKMEVPEKMEETTYSDSEEEGDDDTIFPDHYSYLRTDNFIGLGDGGVTPQESFAEMQSPVGTPGAPRQYRGKRRRVQEMSQALLHQAPALARDESLSMTTVTPSPGKVFVFDPSLDSRLSSAEYDNCSLTELSYSEDFLEQKPVKAERGIARITPYSVVRRDVAADCEEGADVAVDDADLIEAAVMQPVQLCPAKEADCDFPGLSVEEIKQKRMLALKGGARVDLLEHYVEGEDGRYYPAAGGNSMPLADPNAAETDSGNAATYTDTVRDGEQETLAKYVLAEDGRYYSINADGSTDFSNPLDDAEVCNIVGELAGCIFGDDGCLYVSHLVVDSMGRPNYLQPLHNCDGSDVEKAANSETSATSSAVLRPELLPDAGIPEQKVGLGMAATPAAGDDLCETAMEACLLHALDNSMEIDTSTGDLRAEVAVDAGLTASHSSTNDEFVSDTLQRYWVGGETSPHWSRAPGDDSALPGEDTHQSQGTSLFVPPKGQDVTMYDSYKEPLPIVVSGLSAAPPLSVALPPTATAAAAEVDGGLSPDTTSAYALTSSGQVMGPDGQPVLGHDGQPVVLSPEPGGGPGGYVLAPDGTVLAPNRRPVVGTDGKPVRVTPSGHKIILQPSGRLATDDSAPLSGAHKPIVVPPGSCLLPPGKDGRVRVTSAQAAGERLLVDRDGKPVTLKGSSGVLVAAGPDGRAISGPDGKPLLAQAGSVLITPGLTSYVVSSPGGRPVLDEGGCPVCVPAGSRLCYAKPDGSALGLTGSSSQLVRDPHTWAVVLDASGRLAVAALAQESGDAAALSGQPLRVPPGCVLAAIGPDGYVPNRDGKRMTSSNGKPLRLPVTAEPLALILAGDGRPVVATDGRPVVVSVSCELAMPRPDGTVVSSSGLLLVDKNREAVKLNPEGMSFVVTPDGSLATCRDGRFVRVAPGSTVLVPGKNGKLKGADGKKLLGPDGKFIKVDVPSIAHSKDPVAVIIEPGNKLVRETDGKPVRVPPTSKIFCANENGEIFDKNGKPLLGSNGAILQVVPERSLMILGPNEKPILDKNGSVLTMAAGCQLAVPGHQECILGPDGRPVLDAEGRPLAVDPGCRLLPTLADGTVCLADGSKVTGVDGKPTKAVGGVLLVVGPDDCAVADGPRCRPATVPLGSVVVLPRQQVVIGPEGWPLLDLATRRAVSVAATSDMDTLLVPADEDGHARATVDGMPVRDSVGRVVVVAPLWQLLVEADTGLPVVDVRGQPIAVLPGSFLASPGQLLYVVNPEDKRVVEDPADAQPVWVSVGTQLCAADDDGYVTLPQHHGGAKLLGTDEFPLRVPAGHLAVVGPDGKFVAYGDGNPVFAPIGCITLPPGYDFVRGISGRALEDGAGRTVIVEPGTTILEASTSGDLVLADGTPVTERGEARRPIRVTPCSLVLVSPDGHLVCTQAGAPLTVPRGSRVTAVQQEIVLGPDGQAMLDDAGKLLEVAPGTKIMVASPDGHIYLPDGSKVKDADECPILLLPGKQALVLPEGKAVADSSGQPVDIPAGSKVTSRPVGTGTLKRPKTAAAAVSSASTPGSLPSQGMPVEATVAVQTAQVFSAAAPPLVMVTSCSDVDGGDAPPAAALVPSSPPPLPATLPPGSLPWSVFSQASATSLSAEKTIEASYCGPSFGADLNPDNVAVDRSPVFTGFLVSFMVDARGGAMRGCRHAGVRLVIPPHCASCPTRVTCRMVKKERLLVGAAALPPLGDAEALAARIVQLSPVGAHFLRPVIIEIPHFASMRGREREVVIMRSNDGQTWKEHTLKATDDLVSETVGGSFDDIEPTEDLEKRRITRILTADFPQYFALVTRPRQETTQIGPAGGILSSTVVSQAQAVFPEGALNKHIRVGIQALPVPADVVARLLGNRVAVSAVVTVEPRRRRFHKPITLTMPVPKAAQRGMVNQYEGEVRTLRLLYSISEDTSPALWEDITGSTSLTFVSDCVSFTTTLSARFWLVDCQNTSEVIRMATSLYKEIISVPFMSKFVVFGKRHEPREARLRVFCMTDDKIDKTLEMQEHFHEIARSRDIEVLEGKPLYVEMAGSLLPVTRSSDEQLHVVFCAFRENRLPFIVRVRGGEDTPDEAPLPAGGRIAFMRRPKAGKTEAPQMPLCNLNLRLPDYEVEYGAEASQVTHIEEKFGCVNDRKEVLEELPLVARTGKLGGQHQSEESLPCSAAESSTGPADHHAQHQQEGSLLIPDTTSLESNEAAQEPEPCDEPEEVETPQEAVEEVLVASVDPRQAASVKSQSSSTTVKQLAYLRIIEEIEASYPDEAATAVVHQSIMQGEAVVEEVIVPGHCLPGAILASEVRSSSSLLSTAPYIASDEETMAATPPSTPAETCIGRHDQDGNLSAEVVHRLASSCEQAVNELSDDKWSEGGADSSLWDDAGSDVASFERSAAANCDSIENIPNRAVDETSYRSDSDSVEDDKEADSGEKDIHLQHDTDAQQAHSAAAAGAPSLTFSLAPTVTAMADNEELVQSPAVVPVSATSSDPVQSHVSASAAADSDEEADVFTSINDQDLNAVHSSRILETIDESPAAYHASLPVVWQAPSTCASVYITVDQGLNEIACDDKNDGVSDNDTPPIPLVYERSQSVSDAGSSSYEEENSGGEIAANAAITARRPPPRRHNSMPNCIAPPGSGEEFQQQLVSLPEGESDLAAGSNSELSPAETCDDTLIDAFCLGGGLDGSNTNSGKSMSTESCAAILESPIVAARCDEVEGACFGKLRREQADGDAQLTYVSYDDLSRPASVVCTRAGVCAEEDKLAKGDNYWQSQGEDGWSKVGIFGSFEELKAVAGNMSGGDSGLGGDGYPHRSSDDISESARVWAKGNAAPSDSSCKTVLDARDSGLSGSNTSMTRLYLESEQVTELERSLAVSSSNTRETLVTSGLGEELKTMPATEDANDFSKTSEETHINATPGDEVCPVATTLYDPSPHCDLEDWCIIDDNLATETPETTLDASSQEGHHRTSSSDDRTQSCVGGLTVDRLPLGVSNHEQGNSESSDSEETCSTRDDSEHGRLDNEVLFGWHSDEDAMSTVPNYAQPDAFIACTQTLHDAGMLRTSHVIDGDCAESVAVARDFGQTVESDDESLEVTLAPVIILEQDSNSTESCDAYGAQTPKTYPALYDKDPSSEIRGNCNLWQDNGQLADSKVPENDLVPAGLSTDSTAQSLTGVMGATYLLHSGEIVGVVEGFPSSSSTTAAVVGPSPSTASGDVCATMSSSLSDDVFYEEGKTKARLSSCADHSPSAGNQFHTELPAYSGQPVHLEAADDEVTLPCDQGMPNDAKLTRAELPGDFPLSELVNGGCANCEASSELLLPPVDHTADSLHSIAVDGPLSLQSVADAVRAAGVTAPNVLAAAPYLAELFEHSEFGGTHTPESFGLSITPEDYPSSDVSPTRDAFFVSGTYRHAQRDFDEDHDSAPDSDTESPAEVDMAAEGDTDSLDHYADTNDPCFKHGVDGEQEAKAIQSGTALVGGYDTGLQLSETYVDNPSSLTEFGLNEQFGDDLENDRVAAASFLINHVVAADPDGKEICDAATHDCHDTDQCTFPKEDYKLLQHTDSFDLRGELMAETDPKVQQSIESDFEFVIDVCLTESHIEVGLEGEQKGEDDAATASVLGTSISQGEVAVEEPDEQSSKECPVNADGRLVEGDAASYLSNAASVSLASADSSQYSDPLKKSVHFCDQVTCSTFEEDKPSPADLMSAAAANFKAVADNSEDSCESEDEYPAEVPESSDDGPSEAEDEYDTEGERWTGSRADDQQDGTCSLYDELSSAERLTNEQEEESQKASQSEQEEESQQALQSEQEEEKSQQASQSEQEEEESQQASQSEQEEEESQLALQSEQEEEESQLALQSEQEEEESQQASQSDQEDEESQQASQSGQEEESQLALQSEQEEEESQQASQSECNQIEGDRLCLSLSLVANGNTDAVCFSSSSARPLKDLGGARSELSELVSVMQDVAAGCPPDVCTSDVSVMPTILLSEEKDYTPVLEDSDVLHSRASEDKSHWCELDTQLIEDDGADGMIVYSHYDSKCEDSEEEQARSETDYSIYHERQLSAVEEVSESDCSSERPDEEDVAVAEYIDTILQQATAASSRVEHNSVATHAQYVDMVLHELTEQIASDSLDHDGNKSRTTEQNGTTTLSAIASHEDVCMALTAPAELVSEAEADTDHQSLDDEVEHSSVDSYATVVMPLNQQQDDDILEDRLADFNSMTSSLHSSIMGEDTFRCVTDCEPAAVAVEAFASKFCEAEMDTQADTPTSDQVYSIAKSKDVDALSMSSLSEFETLEHETESRRSVASSPSTPRRHLSPLCEQPQLGELQTTKRSASTASPLLILRRSADAVADDVSKRSSVCSLEEFEIVEEDIEVCDEVEREALKVVDCLESGELLLLGGSSKKHHEPSGGRITGPAPSAAIDQMAFEIRSGRLVLCNLPSVPAQIAPTAAVGTAVVPHTAGTDASTSAMVSSAGDIEAIILEASQNVESFLSEFAEDVRVSELAEENTRVPNLADENTRVPDVSEASTDLMQWSVDSMDAMDASPHPLKSPETHCLPDVPQTASQCAIDSLVCSIDSLGDQAVDSSSSAPATDADAPILISSSLSVGDVPVGGSVYIDIIGQQIKGDILAVPYSSVTSEWSEGGWQSESDSLQQPNSQHESNQMSYVFQTSFNQMSASFHQTYPQVLNPFSEVYNASPYVEAEEFVLKPPSPPFLHTSPSVTAAYSSDYRYEPKQKVFTMAELEAERTSRRLAHLSKEGVCVPALRGDESAPLLAPATCSAASPTSTEAAVAGIPQQASAVQECEGEKESTEDLLR